MRPVHWLYTIPLRLRSLFHRRQADQELDDELRDHLERKTEEYAAQGMTQEEAHRRAGLDLDGIEQTKEKCRDARRVNRIQDLTQDLRYGLRILRKSPGFTGVAVLILALGIGANTAVFSVVNAVLLKPLAYRDPDRIVALYNFSPTETATALPEPVSIPDVQDWHDQSSSFEAMAYYSSRESAVVSGPTAEYARVTRVSPEFFRIFVVEPVLGRLFTAEEMKPGAVGAVLLSYAYWQSHFGDDANALGQTIRV